MTVATIFINFANCSQPISSGLAVILNPDISFEEVETIVKGIAQNIPAQAGTTIEPTLGVIAKALEGKASIGELKIITINTELFG